MFFFFPLGDFFKVKINLLWSSCLHLLQQILPAEATSVSKHGAVVGLHQVLCCGCLVLFLGFQMWEHMCLWLVCLFLKLLPSSWVALSSFSVRAFALSYYILLCCIWWLSLAGLPFSDGRWAEGSESQEKEEWNKGKLVRTYCMREESIFNKKITL